MASTMSPVPSGDPSSTISISRRESFSSTAAISRAMFSRSLYVGTMTRPRSGTRGRVLAGCATVDECAKDRKEYCGRHCGHGDPFPGLVRSVDELELHFPGALRKWYGHDIVIRARHARGTPVHGGTPTRKEVLRDDESVPGCYGTSDANVDVSGVEARDRGASAGRLRHRVETDDRHRGIRIHDRDASRLKAAIEHRRQRLVIGALHDRTCHPGSRVLAGNAIQVDRAARSIGDRPKDLLWRDRPPRLRSQLRHQ